MRYIVSLMDPRDPDNPEGSPVINWFDTNDLMRARECSERLEACGLVPFIFDYDGVALHGQGRPPKLKVVR